MKLSALDIAGLTALSLVAVAMFNRARAQTPAPTQEQALGDAERRAFSFIAPDSEAERLLADFFARNRRTDEALRHGFP